MALLAERRVKGASDASLREEFGLSEATLGMLTTSDAFKSLENIARKARGEDGAP